MLSPVFVSPALNFALSTGLTYRIASLASPPCSFLIGTLHISPRWSRTHNFPPPLPSSQLVQVAFCGNKYWDKRLVSRALTRDQYLWMGRWRGSKKWGEESREKLGFEAGPAKSWLTGWRALQCTGPIRVVPGWARALSSHYISHCCGLPSVSPWLRQLSVAEQTTKTLTAGGVRLWLSNSVMARNTVGYRGWRTEWVCARACVCVRARTHTHTHILERITSMA